jgi:hypothetical protein
MGLSDDLNGKEILSYLPIDRLNEGLGIIKPKENQKFYYSSEYLGDHSENWIQVIQDNQIIAIINPSDCFEIIFKEK